MIFANVNLHIGENESICDHPITLYRGDRNVQIRFILKDNKFNVIEQTYAQLIINRPSATSLFTDYSIVENNAVVLTISGEMIDEIKEIGTYQFQIRLFDDNLNAQVTLPPCYGGIIIERPIAMEGDSVVGRARANDSIVMASDETLDPFDENGNYIKTDWKDGDLITDSRLNKMEDGIYSNRFELNDIKNALVALEEPPVYKNPSATISVTPTLIEQGVDTSVNISYNYVKNDGGDVNHVIYYANDQEVSSPHIVNSNTQFKMELYYNEGPIKQTNLGNPYLPGRILSGTIIKTANVVAVGMSYYGVGEAVNTVLKNTKNFTWDNINCEKDILIYKYPKSFGMLTSIKDANNFDYINSYTVTEETINDISYYVYTLTDPMSITGFKQIYN